MSTLVQPFDLAVLQAGTHLTRLMEDTFHSAVLSVSKIGEGFYAYVYKISLAKEPKEVIVKCHKYAGRSEQEKKQLEVLRKHALVKVPEVYALHLYTDAFPCEALSMEYIPGLNASKVEFPNQQLQRRFVDAVVENLLVWHAVSNPHGFGDLDGPFYPTWPDYFERRIGSYHARIHQDRHKRVVSGYVMGIIERSWAELTRIFPKTRRPSSLVHSDYNAWNMLVDPLTYELTGIIDPIDAGWSDYEIDLFHLPNCQPELGLLARYLQEIDVDEPFWLRYNFYRFWDDVKHYLRMGWYSEERFRGYAKALEQAMDECLD